MDSRKGILLIFGSASLALAVVSLNLLTNSEASIQVPSAESEIGAIAADEDGLDPALSQLYRRSGGDSLFDEAPLEEDEEEPEELWDPNNQDPSIVGRGFSRYGSGGSDAYERVGTTASAGPERGQSQTPAVKSKSNKKGCGRRGRCRRR